jgi:hypothetical protein
LFISIVGEIILGHHLTLSDIWGGVFRPKGVDLFIPDILAAMESLESRSIDSKNILFIILAIQDFGMLSNLTPCEHGND